jgi:hypothetical protein
MSMMEARLREFALKTRGKLNALGERSLPPGGANGQLLAKCSDGSFACAWVDAPSGGLSSDPTTFTAIAGEVLGGGRATYISPDDGKAYLADNGDPSCQLLCGLTKGAAALGATVTIQTDGAMTDLAWLWISGPIFLGSNGLLTQTPPVSGFVVQTGVPLGPTQMRIDPRLVAIV